MFTNQRISSARNRGTRLVLACVFAVGLAIGAALDLAPYSRGSAAAPPPVRAQRAAAPVVRTVYAANVLRVLDGDTFEARVRLWPGLEITTKVRLRGIDAPEMKARCDEEIAKALAARDTLQAILDEGEVVISAVALDKYGGRVLADVSTRTTPDISTALLNAGLVRSYAGRRREPWCS
jgi:endonuclease YncB( thermonuclease family)